MPMLMLIFDIHVVSYSMHRMMVCTFVGSRTIAFYGYYDGRFDDDNVDVLCCVVLCFLRFYDNAVVMVPVVIC